MHKEIVYGLGLSLMDLKVKPQVEEAVNQRLPRDFEQFVRFIDQSELIHSCAGGIVSNILMAFAKMKPSSHVGLFAAIGTDTYGDLYQKKVQQQLGQLQRIEDQPTGLVGYLIDYENGDFIDKVSFYKAAEYASVSIEQLRADPQGIFVSSAALFNMPHLHAELNKALLELKNKDALFSLNLGGCRPDKTDRQTLINELTSSYLFPELIFGNEKEILYASDETEIRPAIDSLFPNARILVSTRDGRGSLVRYEGKIIEIPAFPLNPVSRVDESGAGDCYMGVMLAILNEYPFNQWNEAIITNAAKTAAFAAARVVESDETQLPDNVVPMIQRYYSSLL